MNKILSWDEIEKHYNQEWVELIDYDWPDGKPYPNAGRVRIHAPERKKFHELVSVQPPLGSALIFVGQPKNDSTVVHTNLCRVTSCT